MLEVVVEARTGFGLAAVMARKGVSDAAVAAALGVAAPAAARWTRGEDVTLLGTGPGNWLAYSDTGAATHAASLRAKLGPVASVSDQSGGYVIFRIAGADAQALLQRGAPVDLHPKAFPPGAVAVTVIAHIGVILWRLEATTFELAVFRSYAGSFRDWLDPALAAL